MLESAKVTLSYKEFTEIVNTNEKLTKENEKLLERAKKQDEEFEKNIFVKALDEIEQLMQSAKIKNTLNKKDLIKETLKIYCRVFDISEKEVL